MNLTSAIAITRGYEAWGNSSTLNIYGTSDVNIAVNEKNGSAIHGYIASNGNANFYDNATFTLRHYGNPVGLDSWADYTFTGYVSGVQLQGTSNTIFEKKQVKS